MSRVILKDDNAYFDYDPTVRDWTDDNDEVYYINLNEAYLTIDMEYLDFILGQGNDVGGGQGMGSIPCA